MDKLPVSADSAQLISAIGLDAPVHADFGSGKWDGGPIGIPFDVVSQKTPTHRVSFEYADESDRVRYPIPSHVHIEGGAHATGDRHAILVDKSTCRLYELYDLRHTGHGWTAGSGAVWSLRSNHLRPAGWTSADAAGLPIFPGLARWDEVARGADRPRAALHRARDAARVRLSRAPLRVELERPVTAADGAAREAEGERERLVVPAAGARRAPRSPALRDDPRRQRLALVHLGRARTSTGRTTSSTRSAASREPTSRSSTRPRCPSPGSSSYAATTSRRSRIASGSIQWPIGHSR